MTGAEVQARLDGVVEDLQSVKGRGQTINFMFRNPNGSPNILPLSSDAGGVVNAAQLAAVQGFVDGLKTALDAYNTASAPVEAAREAFNTAREPHEPAFTTAKTARETLSSTLKNDAVYTGAKTALETARSDAAYIAARDAYIGNNVSENISELIQAKGAYVV